MPKTRLNLEISEDIARMLNEVADAEETTKSEIVRRALSVIKAYRQQQKIGRSHIGFTSRPENLEAELIGVLSETPDDQQEEAA